MMTNMDTKYSTEPGKGTARNNSVNSDLSPEFEKYLDNRSRKESVISTTSSKISRRPSTSMLMENGTVHFDQSRVESKIRLAVIKTLAYVLVVFLLLYNTLGVTILLIENYRRDPAAALHQHGDTEQQAAGPTGPISSAARKQGAESFQFCVPCSNISSQPSIENIELDKLPKKWLNGKQLCCADDATHLMIILRRALDRQLSIERAKGSLCQGTSSGTGGFPSPAAGNKCVREDVPAAHMVGHRNPTGKQRKNGPGVVENWAEHGRLGFRRSINYKKGTGKLQIPKDGKYYVYSQIRFIEDTSKGVRTPYIDHGIQRYSPMSNHAELLLDRRQSNCVMANVRISEYSSYIGGVVQLDRGDELYVNVSNVALVSQDHNANFFGLFLV